MPNTEWRVEREAGDAVAIAAVGPFELRAYRTYFTVTGPRLAVTGPAPTMDDACHLAIDALRRRLACVKDVALDGASGAEIRTVLTELDRLMP